MSAAPILAQHAGFEPGASMRRRLAGFVDTLRGAGFAIGQAEATDAARVLGSPAADRPDSLRAALKALFCSRQAELARFDELFAAFWRGRGVRQAMRIAALGGGKRRGAWRSGRAASRRGNCPTGVSPIIRGMGLRTAAGAAAARRRMTR